LRQLQQQRQQANLKGVSTAQWRENLLINYLLRKNMGQSHQADSLPPWNKEGLADRLREPFRVRKLFKAMLWTPGDDRVFSKSQSLHEFTLITKGVASAW
jgi:hypothetical protein